MPEKKDSFSDLMGAGETKRRRRRVAPTGPAAGKGPSGPAMKGPSGPAMKGPAAGGTRRRRRRAGDDDLMKQLYG